jgi:hypothetical protein
VCPIPVVLRPGASSPPHGSFGGRAAARLMTAADPCDQESRALGRLLLPRWNPKLGARCVAGPWLTCLVDPGQRCVAGAGEPGRHGVVSAVRSRGLLST